MTQTTEHAPEAPAEDASAAPAERAPREATASLVDALFDFGEAWAIYGLRAARRALVSAAEGLSKAARAVEAAATKLEKPATA